MTRLNVRTISFLGVLGALGVLLILVIRFPLIPAASYLEYEPGDVPVILGSFIFGPVAGFILTCVVAFVQFISVSSGSGWVGLIMHIIATGAFVLIAGALFKKIGGAKGAVIALLGGTIAMVLVMIPSNLFFTVKFWGTPYETVVKMLPTVIIPFNLLKAGINSVLVFILFKPVINVFKKTSELR